MKTGAGEWAEAQQNREANLPPKEPSARVARKYMSFIKSSSLKPTRLYFFFFFNASPITGLCMFPNLRVFIAA